MPPFASTVPDESPFTYTGPDTDPDVSDFELDSLNQWLEDIGEANDGMNHGSSYEFFPLPAAGSMKEALDIYFSSIYTGRCPPQPAKSWNIGVAEMTEPESDRAAVAHYWFYGLEFSPIEDAATKERNVKEFLRRLGAAVGFAKVFGVGVSSPSEMWYECHWQDFAFDTGSTRWFLHFGFSD